MPRFRRNRTFVLSAARCKLARSVALDRCSLGPPSQVGLRASERRACGPVVLANDRYRTGKRDDIEHSGALAHVALFDAYQLSAQDRAACDRGEFHPGTMMSMP